MAALDQVLEELGIAQYLEAFVDQGFDSWETILDITESDLDALGVKLGHRRKLQRRIAKFRGIAPDVALASPTRPTVEETPRPEGNPKQETPGYGPSPSATASSAPGAVTKRKYRRHPKPDENAPERPPSAYVLFSNKMREELKGRSLSFTEIAKLVGENWQSLSPAEREPFETQAQMAKDKYSHDLVEYKKTPEYHKYMLYLQEFKTKHSHQTQDAFKRIKLADFANASISAAPPVSSTSPPAPPKHCRSRSITAYGSGSSTDGHYGSENVRPSSHRGRRVGSLSASDSHYSSASPTPGPPTTSLDGSMHSPPAHLASEGHPDRSPHRMSMSPREPLSDHSSRRNSLWHPETSQPQAHSRGLAEKTEPASSGGGPVSLPSLSNMFDERRLSPNGLPLGSKADFGPPAGAPLSFGSSYTRSPLDGSLPIHALLSGKAPSPGSPPPPSHAYLPSHAPSHAPAHPPSHLLSHSRAPSQTPSQPGSSMPSPTVSSSSHRAQSAHPPEHAHARHHHHHTVLSPLLPPYSVPAGVAEHQPLRQDSSTSASIASSSSTNTTTHPQPSGGGQYTMHPKTYEREDDRFYSK